MKYMAICEGFKVNIIQAGPKVGDSTYLFPFKDGCYLPSAMLHTDIAGHSVTAGHAGEMPVGSTMR